jgi:hypothetical protein
MLSPLVSDVTQALVQDRQRELRAAAARGRTAKRVHHHHAMRVWLGWTLVRAGWRLAASGRRASVTILGRTTL